MTFNKKIKLRKNYKFFREISTRWNDNDIYGHINNATYYQFFDTAINFDSRFSMHSYPRTL